MKRKVLTICLLLTVLWALDAWCQTAFVQQTHILIAGDEEKEGSYLVELTQEAFQRVGYTPEFRFVPWARALKLSIKGDYKVLLAAYFSEERAEKLAYTAPIGSTRVFFLKRKDQSMTYTTMDDLKPYRIGHIRGSKVNTAFDEAEKTFLTMEYVSSTEQNINKLLAGRLDLVVEKEERLTQLLKTEFQDDADKLELIYPPLQVNPFYNCVSKALPNAQQIVDDFNRGLQMIREDGTLSTILTKYGVASD